MSAELIPRILVVDDEAANRLLIGDLLEANGHEVIGAESARSALQLISKHDFDVLLLDVMMKEMDGFELCSRIREQTGTHHLPIIMVTALANRESRLKGIRAGAVDYLTKPIDTRDLSLRVRNHVYAKQLSDKLRQSLRELNEFSKLRDNLTEMMVHDLRTPLMGLLNSLELLHMRSAEILSDKENKNVVRARHLVLTLIEMISSILDVSRFEARSMPLNVKQHDLKMIIQQAFDSLGELTTSPKIEKILPDGNFPVQCDADILRRVIVNLLGNALKFTPRMGQIQLTLMQDESSCKVSIFNTGTYIPEESRVNIFGKFKQVDVRTSGHKYSTGLGLTFCKLALEAHNGSIGVNSELDVGSTFWFTLPFDDSGPLT